MFKSVVTISLCLFIFHRAHADSPPVSSNNPFSKFKGLDSSFAAKINTAINNSLTEWNSIPLEQDPNSEEYIHSVGKIQTKEKQEEILSVTRQLNDAKNFDCQRDSSSDLPDILKNYSKETFCNKKQEILQKSVLHLFALTMDLPDATIMKTNDPSVIRMIQAYVRDVKAYDPKMGDDEIFQASRNIWIASILQKLLQVNVKLTPSLFGYSMLYPYTDNVFDDPNLNKKDKMNFAVKFGKMLLGAPYEVESWREQQVSDMVNRMYLEYPMSQYPEVKQSLISIYYGQMESMKQRDPSTSPQKILWISSFKGGTSVLADAFLAKSRLTEEEFKLAFDFGFLLQMVDDLQDLKNDQDPHFNSHTVFHNPLLSKKERGDLVIRLINYSKIITQRLSQLYPSNEELGLTMHNFSRLLIFESVARQQDQFEPAFVEQLDQHSVLKMKALEKAEIEKNIYGVMNKIAL